MQWAAMLFGVVTGCARAPRPPPSVSQFDTTLVYEGAITREGLVALQRLDNPRARTLLIRSGGGPVDVGLDFGEWIHDRGFNVVVNQECLSSCANYIFPAGDQKLILPGGLVAWHGNAHQLSVPELISKQPTAEQPAARAQMLALRARENAFYSRIGVSECLDRIGIDVLEVRGFFTMSVRDMARFGLHKVKGAATKFDDVSEEVRENLKFWYIDVPSSMGAAPRCPKREL